MAKDNTEWLEKLGPERVRLMILARTELNTRTMTQAVQWLAAQDQESRDLRDRRARTDRKIEIAALIMATVAAIAAIVAAIATILV